MWSCSYCCHHSFDKHRDPRGRTWWSSGVLLLQGVFDMRPSQTLFAGVTASHTPFTVVQSVPLKGYVMTLSWHSGNLSLTLLIFFEFFLLKSFLNLTFSTPQSNRNPFQTWSNILRKQNKAVDMLKNDVVPIPDLVWCCKFTPWIWKNN